MTQNKPGHRAPLAPGEIRTHVVGERKFTVMHIAGGSLVQAREHGTNKPTVVLRTSQWGYRAIDAYADAIEAAEAEQDVNEALAAADDPRDVRHAANLADAYTACGRLRATVRWTDDPETPVDCPKCAALPRNVVNRALALIEDACSIAEDQQAGGDTYAAAVTLSTGMASLITMLAPYARA